MFNSKNMLSTDQSSRGSNIFFSCNLLEVVRSKSKNLQHPKISSRISAEISNRKWKPGVFGEMNMPEDNSVPMDISPESSPPILVPEIVEMEATGNLNSFEELTVPVVKKPKLYRIEDLEDTSNRRENIANPCPVDSNADYKKTTTRMRLRDKKIVRPISLIKGRIWNPKFNTQRKPDIRDDDCLQGKKTNRQRANVLQCVDTSGASDATLGANDEDVTEMQNHIDMSSEIIQTIQSPPKDSNVNIPLEDQETLANHSNVPRNDVCMDHDSSTDKPKNRTDVNETDKGNSTHSPEDVHVTTEPIFEHNASTSDAESSSSVFSVETDLLEKEWGELAVLKMLVVLWRHICLVTPERLLGQGRRCGNMEVARDKMFCSLLCLKSRGLVRFVKDFLGQIKYITKGKRLTEHS